MTKNRLRRETHHGRIVRCFASRPATINAMFREAVERKPDGIAVIAGDIRLPYRELESKVDLVSGNLARFGLSRGDRVGVLLGNCIEFLVVVLAAARIGAIVIPMNIRQRQREIHYMLAHSQAVMLVCEASLVMELPRQADLTGLRHIFVVGGSAEQGFSSYDLLLSADGNSHPASMVSEDDPFCILYTSGTTGVPKGAVLTHFGVIHSVMHFEEAFPLLHGDIAALAVPASHVTGLVAILLAAIRVSGTTVLIDRFSAKEFLEIASEERVNYTLMVPAMYKLCLLEPAVSAIDLSAWRVGGFGGAPMSSATIQEIADRLPRLEMSNIYGATETTSPASLLNYKDIQQNADTVGRPLPCADIIVVDGDGHEVDAGMPGELLIGGPMTVPYYWDNEAANCASFVGGYWRSGDVGSIDSNGYLRIYDRRKDVINRAGYKVYCVEVESVLAGFPGLVECAVVGYPDSVLGERVAAFIRLENHIPEGARQIREFCESRLSDYKVPEKIELMQEALPRNANGKILKVELRNLLLPGSVVHARQ